MLPNLRFVGVVPLLAARAFLWAKELPSHPPHLGPRVNSVAQRGPKIRTLAMRAKFGRLLFPGLGTFAKGFCSRAAASGSLSWLCKECSRPTRACNLRYRCG